ncbi:MAG: hypothetical protein V3T83_13955 [Acidobacteriota bacterium]
MLKQISKWISFTVSSAVSQGHPGHVPGAFPAYGDYSNWMAVRGIHTSENAFPLPANLEVFGFWINDPFPAGLGGIGENSDKTAQEFPESGSLILTYSLQPTAFPRSSPDLSIGGRSSAGGHAGRRLASRDDPAGLEPPQVMAPRGRAPWWPRDSLKCDSSCQSWLRRGGPGGGLTLSSTG